MRRTGNSTPHSGTYSLSLSSGGVVPFLWRQPLTPPSPNRCHGLTVTGLFDPPLTPPPALIGALPRLAPAVAPPVLSGIWRPPCRRRRTAQRLLVASKEERCCISQHNERWFLLPIRLIISLRCSQIRFRWLLDAEDCTIRF
ncbi:hypothetical protein GQ55_2G261200 [Panicum hallii var. hallii]|uniref:Uncharacterized protein n=1 Tax=Panicum hallii var. hallii TaxID=1504633 RepID=A0A2T7ESF6_9POAL|nr:hypothetical protein GQ55_2G261200 [Panicum hallii var. hallii]